MNNDITLQSAGAGVHRMTSLRGKLAAWALAVVVRLWYATLRVKPSERLRAMYTDVSRPNIFLLWHNRILMGPLLYFISRRNRKIYTMISASKDGALATAVLGYLKMGVVRGSSSRRSVQAMRELMAALNNDTDIVMTPDGPRGPMYEMSPGVSLLLRHTNARVVFLMCKPRRARRINSWDGMYLPCPFTTVEFDAVPADDDLRTGADDDYTFRDTLQKHYRGLTVDDIPHPRQRRDEKTP